LRFASISLLFSPLPCHTTRLPSLSIAGHVRLLDGSHQHMQTWRSVQCYWWGHRGLRHGPRPIHHPQLLRSPSPALCSLSALSLLSLLCQQSAAYVCTYICIMIIIIIAIVIAIVIIIIIVCVCVCACVCIYGGWVCNQQYLYSVVPASGLLRGVSSLGLFFRSLFTLTRSLLTLNRVAHLLLNLPEAHVRSPSGHGMHTRFCFFTQRPALCTTSTQTHRDTETHTHKQTYIYIIHVRVCVCVCV
jgi:hypothetical protein